MLLGMGMQRSSVFTSPNQKGQDAGVVSWEPTDNKTLWKNDLTIAPILLILNK
jgi:hypothetical protein